MGDQDAFNGSNYLVPNSSLKDYVFDFNGSNDYIDCGTGLGDSIGDNYAGSLTASLWFKRSSTALGGIINFTTSGWGEFTVLAYSNEIRFAINVAAYRISYNSAAGYVYDTDWHHLALVMTPNGSVTDIKMYFDGQLLTITPAGSSPIPGLLDFAGLNLFIGAFDSTSYSFNGSISNTQIFNTALPATGSNSVETLYNNGSPLTSMSGFTSLQGWWKLDATATFDGSNWSIPDDSTNSNTGTSFGMTQANLVQSDLSFTSGYSPYALDFDGTNDYIDCGDSDDFSFGNGTTDSEFTFSAWINADNYPSGSICILGKDQTNNNREYVLGVWNAKVKIFIKSQGGNNQQSIDSTTSLSANQWYHIAATYDGRGGSNAADGLTIYINGIAETPTNITKQSYTAMSNTTSYFAIGQYFNAAFFNGKISNVSIWNTDLTSAQVSELYNEGVPSNLNNHSAYSNLVSWWQLGSNSSFNSSLNQWTCIDEKGTNTGESSQTFNEDAIVDGVGSYANGLSSGMGGDEVIGDAPYSSSNALSVNMDVEDRVTDTPS
jgi:hypothetical protein